MGMLSINVLLSGCPILETLENHFWVKDYDKICLPPTLKTLKIIVDIDDGVASFVMNGLVFYHINSTKTTLSDVGNLQYVAKASLDIFRSLDYSDDLDFTSLLNLLTALSGIKHLALSRSTTKVWFYYDGLIYRYSTKL
jgi:hypothetical protein